MLLEHSVPFHLIYSAEDLCNESGCKWCASMKPWVERNQKITKPSMINPLKLDVNAPEFVPAAGRVANRTAEIYATPKQPNFVPKMHGGGGDFKHRFQANDFTRGSSSDDTLKRLLYRSLPNRSMNKHHTLSGIAEYQSRLEPLRHEESRAAISAKAWELATETFNESLLECVPHVLQYSGRVLANNAVQKINECEAVIMRMGREAVETMLRIKASGHDLPQVNLLLDMRLDTIATILEMKREEVKVLLAAKVRARTQEDALRVEMENTFHIFNALENQLQGLHREAARLREEAAEMRAAVF